MDFQIDILGNLLEELIDYRGKSPVKTTSGIPLVTAKIIKNGVINEFTEFIAESDYDKWMVRGFPKSGDVVLTTEAPLGEVAQLDDRKIALAQRVVCLRGKSNILDNTYLKYYFLSRYGKKSLKSRESGTTVTGIKQSELRNVEVRFPSYQDQCCIASILKSLDDKIAINRRICANLEAQAQALFKHWFIDFAPFKDGKFVESELGMIPEGWRVGRLDEYVDNLSGYSYKGNELLPSTIAMATIKNFVRGGGFKIDGYKEIIISKNIKKYQYVNLFDVLVAHTDITQNAEVVGNPAIILSTAGYEKLIMSMDLTKVVSHDARITPPLLYSILSTRRFKEHALGYVNGTTVLHMSKKAVPEYKLVMPKDLDVLKELTSVLDNLYSLMSEIYAENLRLSTLRDTLLPRLMSGELQVNEITI